ncbi:MAG: Hsp20/alpha crystallin family protein [Kiritimatiellia bacterium]
MTTDKDTTAVQNPSRNETPQTVYVPPVDIREDGESLTLLADLPGTEQHEVDLSMENGVLTIDAKPTMQAPEGYTLAGQEWDYGTFHRRFQISDAVQVDKITATVRNGTLKVTIPKREEVRTRKIEIGK